MLVANLFDCRYEVGMSGIFSAALVSKKWDVFGELFENLIRPIESYNCSEMGM